MRAGRLVRRFRTLVALSAVALVAVLSIGATGAQAAAQRLVFSPGVNPVRSDATTEDFAAVSCASTKLCAAIFDWSGDLAISSDPAAGASSWSFTTLPNVQSLSSIDCVSTELCLAGDDSGYVWISTDPTGGYTKWHQGPRLNVDSDTAGLNGLTCPTASLCVISDDQGDVYATTDPTGPARAWHHSTVPYERGLYGNNPVVCSSASFCWVEDDGGHVYTTTTPLTGGWKLAPSASGFTQPNPLIACPTGTFCVQVGVDGEVETSGSSSGPWKSGTVTGWSPLTGAVCTKVGRCVAVDGAGNVLSSSPLGASTVKWTVSHVAKASSAGGLTCPRLSLCLTGVAGGVAFSSTPSGAAGSWHVSKIAAVGKAHVNSIGCSSAQLCVAVTSTGEVLASTRPNGPGSSWKLQHKLTALPTVNNSTPESLAFATCPRANLCFAGDPLAAYLEGDTPGMFLWSTQPTKPSSWHGAQLGFGGVSCPAANLCVAETDKGNSSIAYSRNPAAGSKSWHYLGVNDFAFSVPGFGESASTIACASSHLCVAIGQNIAGDGAVAVSTAPTKPGSWKVQALTGADLTSVYCNSAQCVVSSALGELFYASVR